LSLIKTSLFWKKQRYISDKKSLGSKQTRQGRDETKGRIVPVSLTQLVRTMHNICKVWGSNPGHHKKKKQKKNSPNSTPK